MKTTMEYRYSCPWYGTVKRFKTIASAIRSAKKEDDSIAIYDNQGVVKIIEN
jgi:hypothetical protein